MDNQIVIASKVEDGVRYDLVVNKIDSSSWEDVPIESIQQEPRVVASKHVERPKGRSSQT